MFYLELLRQRMLSGNVFWRWEGRKENEIKMSDGTLNLRKGGCVYSSKSCVSTGLEAVVELLLE